MGLFDLTPKPGPREDVARITELLNEARRGVGERELRIQQLERELTGWKNSAELAKQEVAWLREQIEAERERSDRYHAEAVEAARNAPPPLPARPTWAGPDSAELSDKVQEAIAKRAGSDTAAEELRAHALRRRDAERWSEDAIISEILGGAEIDLEMEAL